MALPLVLAGMIPSLVKKGFELFDKKFKTDAEKDDSVRQFESLMYDKIQSAWDEEQKQITERHKNDMLSDSWLSKNIRPATLIYLLVLYTIAFFQTLPEGVLEMLNNLLMAVFAFYFGGRTLDKFTKAIIKRK